ncbi:25896_t:CDS:1, partial [Racocetra persica]
KSSDNPISVNFINVVSQVCINEHPSESNDVNPTPENMNQNNLSNTNNSAIPLSDTRKGIDAATANNNNLITDISTNLLLFQDKNAKQARKDLRPLLSLKK